jgi:hypothetical protein
MSEAKIVVSAEDRSKAVLAGVKASLGQVQAKGQELNEGFGKLGAVLGSAFVGLSFTAFIKSTAAGVDALNDIKDATGSSIENISALEDTALRTGTSLDTVTTSLVKLNQLLNAAEPGSAQALALQSIGLSAEELKKVDPAEALRLTAVALSTFADDGNKARIVQELFGKSIREVAPLLNDLATQGKLVATVTTEQAAEAEKFNRQLTELSKNSVDLARMLTSAVLPVLNTFVERLSSMQRAGGFFSSIFKEFEANKAADDLRVVTKDIERLAGWMKVNPGSKSLADDMRELRTEAERLQKKGAAATDWLKQFSAVQKPVAVDYGNEGRNIPKPSVAALTKLDKPTTPPAEKISEAQTALAAYVKTLQDQIDKTQDLTEKQKALDLLKSLGATGEVPQVRELVLGLERRLTLSRQDDAIQKDITREMEAQGKAAQELDDAIYKYSGRLEDARKIAETTRLEAQLAAGVEYSPQELDNIVKGIAGIKDETKQQLDEMDVMFEQFGRNVQDSLGETIKSSLKGDFDNIGQLWGNLLLDMAAQALAAQIGKQLFGDLFKGGELGGLAKAGASFFGIPGFASGGSHPGGLRIVGENGPELEATGPARIYNAGQTAQLLGAGGKSVSINFAPSIQIDGSVDRARSMQDAQAVMRQGQRELVTILKAKGVM